MSNKGRKVHKLFNDKMFGVIILLFWCDGDFKKEGYFEVGLQVFYIICFDLFNNRYSQIY